MQDPQGRAQLLELGVRHVPVLARGRDYVFAQSLADVAKFVGLPGIGYTPLAPAALVERYVHVLHAAARYVAQFPVQALDERAIQTRDRSIRVLAHHVFRICEAFLESAVDNAFLSLDSVNRGPQPGEFVASQAIAAYGEHVTLRLQAWWASTSDPAVRSREVETYYGTQKLDQLLERSTWHSAQHVRQLIAVLDRLGIEPNGRLGARDFAGLPMPNKLWD